MDISFKDEEYIKFKYEIKLENGIIGKNIEVDGNLTNYIITDDARVINIITMKELKQFLPKKTKYLSVNIQLGKRGKYKTMLVHRLCALAYIPNPYNKPIVNHKDGNKLNLELTNLEWSTYSENNKHAFDTGLKKPTKKSSECNLATHTIEDVEKVCCLLSDGYSPKLISKLYPEYGYNFVNKILRHKTWTDISKTYVFPNITRYNSYFTIKEVEEMQKLFKLGLKPKEIIDKMGWEYTEKLRGRVRQIGKSIIIAQDKPL